MADTTQAVIFFVGLALWTTTQGSDVNSLGSARRSNVERSEPSVHVILPRVQHTGQNATERTAVHSMNSGSQRAIRSVDDSPYVVDHIAAIITYAGSFGPISGWPAPVPIGKQTTFSYVPLDGDRVKFVTGDSNPQNLTINNAVLPKLQGVTALNPVGATIFDVPYGSMKSCLSLTRKQMPRLDTKVELATNGTLIISDLAGTKSIQIKPYEGTIMLVVANIPKKYLQGDYSDPSDPLEKVPHVNAFYAMTNASCGNCTQTLKDWFLQHMEEVEPCGSDVTLVGGRIRTDDCLTVSTSEDTISGVMQGSNFMCSNEGWP
jgi:hypothetical protein